MFGISGSMPLETLFVEHATPSYGHRNIVRHKWLRVPATTIIDLSTSQLVGLPTFGISGSRFADHDGGDRLRYFI